MVKYLRIPILRREGSGAMRITMETDYAVRIVYCLARENKVMGAQEICDKTGVAFRFALKILGKLRAAKLIVSFRGVNGGYKLLMAPGDITLLTVYQAVDGDVLINRCVDEEPCSIPGQDGHCLFHEDFVRINNMLKDALRQVNFSRAGQARKQAPHG